MNISKEYFEKALSYINKNEAGSDTTKAWKYELTKGLIYLSDELKNLSDELKKIK